MIGIKFVDIFGRSSAIYRIYRLPIRRRSCVNPVSKKKKVRHVVMQLAADLLQRIIIVSMIATLLVGLPLVSFLIIIITFIIS